MTPVLELFHSIAEPESATVRAFIVNHQLTESVRFRNITYDEVRADFAARGGRRTPALWDGQHLLEGVDSILERLRRLK